MSEPQHIPGRVVNAALMRGPQMRDFFPRELAALMPPLYTGEKLGDPMDALAIVKFFTPASSWTWWLTEYDPKERLFFGFVRGLEDEWGYVSLDELEGLGGAVERDTSFGPTPVREAIRS